MAYEESRFFDSVASDKQYTAEQFAEYFRQFLTSGVFALGDNLKVSATTGMVVSVGFGAAMLDGYGYWLKDDEQGLFQIALPTADTLPRYDTIVVRLDRDVGERSAKIAYRVGTPSSSPAPLGPKREGSIYDIALARVYVGANASSISPANITDVRSINSQCGIVEPKRVRDYINQGVKTTDSPTFAAATINGTLTADKVIGAVYQ